MIKTPMILLIIISISFVSAADVLVFQGQYFIDEVFQKGTYDFKFDVYNDKTMGTLIYSSSKSITTGNWGQWKVELEGISAAANDTSKDYWIEIIIDGNPHGSRNKITKFPYLRKDVDEVTEGKITAANFEVEESIRDVFLIETDQRYNDTTWVSSKNYLTNYSESDPLFLLGNLTIWASINSIITQFQNYVLTSDLNYFSGDYNDLLNSPEIVIDTRLSNQEISSMGYIKNYTDTKLTESEVDSFVSNNNYSIGEHVVDTNTHLSEIEVDEYVANNGYLTSISESDPTVWNYNFNITGDSRWLDDTSCAESGSCFNVAYKNELGNYYLKSEIDEKIQNISMDKIEPTPEIDLSNYYTKNEVKNLIDDISVATVSGENIEPQDIFYAYNIESLTIPTTWTDITFDSVVRLDSSYSFSEGDSGIVINSDGWQEISFECTADTTSNSRYMVNWRALQNAEEIPGTRAASYHRQASRGKDTTSISFIWEFDTGDILKFQGLSDHNTQVITVSNGCRILLKKIYEKNESVEDLIPESLIKTDAPKIPEAGNVYFDAIENKLKFYNGNEWKIILFEGDILESSSISISEFKTTEEKKAEKEASRESESDQEEALDLEMMEESESTSDSILSTESGEELIQEVETEKDGEDEEQKEVCKEICKPECETEEICEEICEEIEVCEPKCKTDKDGNEECKDKCKIKEVCEDNCGDIEVCEEVCIEECGIPEELFDIRMGLESTLIRESTDLEAVVTYESFGSVPTPVNLTFGILDSTQNLIYSKDGNITVTSEEVGRYMFPDLNLENGKYTFIFTTIYNVDVFDKFEQPFEIKESLWKKILEWLNIN